MRADLNLFIGATQPWHWLGFACTARIGLPGELVRMEYVLLTPDEAGMLVGRPSTEIVTMLQSGELGGMRVAGSWRIPIISLAVFFEPGSVAKAHRTPPGAGHPNWARVLDAHPEIASEGESREAARARVLTMLRREGKQRRLQRCNDQ